jgi:predicted  nucleic acid-binding Zn-ribbon protein
MRAFVRHKAKMQLQQHCDRVNEELLQELAATQLRAERGALFNQPCDSLQQAAQLEDQLANELIAAYQRIQQQNKNPVVQQLNQFFKL